MHNMTQKIKRKQVKMEKNCMDFGICLKKIENFN